MQNNQNKNKIYKKNNKNKQKLLTKYRSIDRISEKKGDTEEKEE